MNTALENCPGCGVAAGKNHDDNCDHAVCPDCGEQLLMHDCEHWADDAEGPDRPALWHGVDQQAEVARTLNWWTTATGIDHLVEDYTRVVVATALGQVTWDPRAQKYAIGQVDDAELDRAIANSRPW